MEGDSSWLFSPQTVSAHTVIAKVEPRDIVLLAGQLHVNCCGLDIAAAKLYLSDELLLILYFIEAADCSHVAEAVCDLELLLFRPYEFVCADTALMWLAWSSIANCLAIPFKSWASGDMVLPRVRVCKHFVCMIFIDIRCFARVFKTACCLLDFLCIF